MSDGSNDGDRDEIWDERYRKQAIQKQLDELASLRAENQRLVARIAEMGKLLDRTEHTYSSIPPSFNVTTHSPKCPRCQWEKTKEGK